MILGLSNINVFKIFFDVVFEDTDTVEFRGNKNGVNISLLDKSHTCFFNVEYDADFFDDYEVDGVEVFSVFIDDLSKILKTASKSDYLTLSSDDTRVMAKFESNGNSRVFELVQPADFGDSPIPPNVDTTCEVILTFDEFGQSLKDLEILKTGSIHLVFKDKDLYIATETDASMNYQYTIHNTGSGEGDAHYTIDLLKKLLKFKGVDNRIMLNFGNTLPLCWVVEGVNVKMSGLIAPRIVED